MASQRWQLLADCNNFFVSCELLFQPSLVGKPVVVLSSDEGCVVARSNEAKALGITMGQPIFEIRQKGLDRSVMAKSSNFALYNDMSRRVMQLLQESFDLCEVYSIDEAFGFLEAKDPKQLRLELLALRRKLLRWVGLPVSFAASSTRTRCKLLIDKAKKEESYQGVIIDAQRLDGQKLEESITQLPVEAIWGIGKRLAEQLRASAVWSVGDLIGKGPEWARRVLGIEGERIVLELNGTPCRIHEAKQPLSMQVTRSFQRPIVERELIWDALSTFIHTLGDKLRYSRLRVCALLVRLYAPVDRSVNPHSRTAASFSKRGVNRAILQQPYLERLVTFDLPSQDTREILGACHKAFETIAIGADGIKRAGIWAYSLVEEHVTSQEPLDLFQLSKKEVNKGLEEESSREINPESSEKLMQLFDEVRSRYGSDKLTLGMPSQGEKWKPKTAKRSGEFTTNWQQIAQVKA